MSRARPVSRRVVSVVLLIAALAAGVPSVAGEFVVPEGVVVDVPIDWTFREITVEVAEVRREAIFRLRGEEQTVALRRAYELALEAHAVAPDAVARLHTAPYVAWRAFDVGEWDVARRFALESLSELERLRGWPPARMNSGWVTHHAHDVLGLLALRNDDVKSAIEHLLASADHDGAPTLNTFGPNMRLAQALAKRGERGAVLDYLDRCREFVTSHPERLDGWAHAVASGGVPDFGPNLIYGP